MKSENKKKEKSNQPLPEPREVDMQPSDYQPNRAEIDEEIDMPEADLETVRSAFFRPIRRKQSD